MSKPPESPPSTDIRDAGRESPQKDHGAAEQEETARKGSRGRPPQSKR
ncbi:MAG: hypothetical protein JWO65_1390 [Sphingomonas bacterium]|jgi:hypothetical protein|nr:hypothetical protein [Sphingomonas bacterium]